MIQFNPSEYAVIPFEMVFAISRPGKPEVLAWAQGQGSFLLVGAIDVEGDGLAEIVFDRRVISRRAGDDYARQTVVSKQVQNGAWEILYQGRPTCDGLNLDY